jgi:hypothetical protein
MTMRSLNKTIMDTIENAKIPYLVILQSDFSKRELHTKGLTALENHVPCIRMPPNQSDSNFPALNWQSFAVRNMTER